MSEYITVSDPFEGFGARVPASGGKSSVRTSPTGVSAPTARTTRGAALAKKREAVKQAALAKRTAAKRAAAKRAGNKPKIKKKAGAKPMKRKGKGPPPWANAKFMRDADSKVARKMPPGVKALIDRLPLSDKKKDKLKNAPLSFLVDLARNDPQAVSDYIRSAKAEGANVPAPAAGDNPATLATKLVQAATTKPSAGLKAAVAQAVSGFGALGAVSATRTTMVALAPAIVATAPLTLPALKSVSASRVVAEPTAAQVSAADQAANTGASMQDATPPEATAVAEQTAAEEDKILGLPPVVVYGGGGLVAAVLLWRAFKKK